MTKAILFDLDGTLTDTFELWYQSVRELVLKHTDMHLDRDEYEERYWGMDGRGKVKLLIGADGKKIEELYKELQSLLMKNASLVRAFPGVKQSLERLSGSYRLAVISNSPIQFLEAQLSNTGMGSFFSAKVADALPKPDPDGLLRACGELGVHGHEAVFVGDSRFDMEAGRNAGIKTLILGRNLKTIEELLNIL